MIIWKYMWKYCILPIPNYAQFMLLAINVNGT